MRNPFKNKENGTASHRKGWAIFGSALIVLLVCAALVSGGLIWHKQPGFCTLCHTPMKSYVENYFAGDTTLMITRHATADTMLRCLDCHESNLKEQAREGAHWLTGKYTYPLEKRDFGTRSFCLTTGCHVEKEIEEATENHYGSLFTYNQHNSRHGKQDCFQCHSMHGESVFSCNQCHSFELPEGWVSPQPNGVVVHNRQEILSDK